jgi:hypothetical protein
MKAILFLVVGALAGCQSWQTHAPAQSRAPPHRGVGTGAGTSGAMGSTASGGQESGMSDQEAACEMSRRITDAHTPEERQALMDQTMQGMSPEARDEQLIVMRQQCERVLH